MFSLNEKGTFAAKYEDFDAFRSASLAFCIIGSICYVSTVAALTEDGKGVRVVIMVIESIPQVIIAGIYASEMSDDEVGSTLYADLSIGLSVISILWGLCVCCTSDATSEAFSSFA